MPISYSINPAEKLAYVTFPSEIDLKSAFEVMQALAADERLELGFGILVDLRAAKPVPTKAEARMIISIASKRHMFFCHPTALVVSQRLQYGMGTMISTLAGLEGAIVQTFYEVEEAKKSLQMHAHRIE